MYRSEDPSKVQRVACELESLRNVPTHDGVKFPGFCRRLLQSLPGNFNCVDCGTLNPDWASVTYGVLLCLCCSGRHRSYGVATSRIRSISMDAWSHSQVLAMLEGGNEQLQNFFHRHQLGDNSSHRYKTKAAKFYKTHLGNHVQKVGNAGLYKGREASRKKQTPSNQTTKKPSGNAVCRETTRSKKSE